MASKISPARGTSLADKNQNLAIIFFYVLPGGSDREFARRQTIWPAGSYPPFLWITLCIRVRKHKASERIRSFQPNWCERRLCEISYNLQRVR
ncbi:hypothetical protein WM46_10460 [Citrobacter freundii complex sp. CFNIH2]|nr:hypothetical protein WM46_10460 [Citrobacter freundii complex sp. CFNIH2]